MEILPKYFWVSQGQYDNENPGKAFIGLHTLSCTLVLSSRLERGSFSGVKAVGYTSV